MSFHWSSYVTVKSSKELKNVLPNKIVLPKKGNPNYELINLTARVVIQNL